VQAVRAVSRVIVAVLSGFFLLIGGLLLFAAILLFIHGGEPFDDTGDNNAGVGILALFFGFLTGATSFFILRRLWRQRRERRGLVPDQSVEVS
jgi:membrane associated rhomboid family serine protease